MGEDQGRTRGAAENLLCIPSSARIRYNFVLLKYIRTGQWGLHQEQRFCKDFGNRGEIDNRNESCDINNKGINDTDKYIYKSLTQLKASKGPDVSQLSNLFIDQCPSMINSWLVN
jgi:hypothetical protein